MARNRKYWAGHTTSITDTLDRQWEYMAESIFLKNSERSDDEILALLRAENCYYDVGWVRSRRKHFGRKALNR